MSQTSFLEDVVCWSEEECQQRWKEALPKIISCFQHEEDYHKQVGMLKIVCHSFMQFIETRQLEEHVFKQISQTTTVYDKIVAEIKHSLTTSEGISDLHSHLSQLIQLLFDVLNCLESCVLYVLGADNSLELSHIHTLEYTTFHLVHETYTHCKESSQLYDHLLETLTEPLSALFKKAYSLQMCFLNLLDKVSIGFELTEEETQELTYACESLYKLSQIVVSLDIKIAITLWKAVSKLATQYKHSLKDHLDTAAMVTYLSNEIEAGYLYLFELAPRVASDGEPVLSQGDQKAFQKSLKILSFQMKVVVMFAKEYEGYLIGSEDALYQLTLTLLRMRAPCFSAPVISKSSQDDIQRHLLNATEPLLAYSLSNERFRFLVTAKEQDLSEDLFLPRLLVQVSVLDLLPQAPEGVQDKWACPILYPEDEPRDGIVVAVFNAVTKCYVELSTNVLLPGVMCSGNAQSDVSLYEFVCTHLSGYIGSLPSRQFSKCEEALLEGVVSLNPYVSQMARDVWCFIARYGSADLCHTHVRFLCELIQSVSSQETSSGDPLLWNLTPEYSSVIKLLQRLVKFIAPDHQKSLLRDFPASDTLWLWSILPFSSFSPPLSAQILESGVPAWIKLLSNGINKIEKSHQDFIQLAQCIRCLTAVYQNEAATQKNLTPQNQAIILDRVTSLWNIVHANTSLVIRNRAFKCCVISLCHFSVYLIKQFTSSDLMQMLSSMKLLLQDVLCSDQLKLAIIQVLKRLGQVKLPIQESTLITTVPAVFVSVIREKHCMVRHHATDAFMRFAEETPFESIVPECLNDNSGVQDSVTAFVNKVPHGAESSNSPISSLECYKQQRDVLLLYSCKSVEERFVDDSNVSSMNVKNDEIIEEYELDDSSFSDDQPVQKRPKLDEQNKSDTTETESDYHGIIQTISEAVNKLEDLSKHQSIPEIIMPEIHKLANQMQALASR